MLSKYNLDDRLQKLCNKTNLRVIRDVGVKLFIRLGGFPYNLLTLAYVER